ncbi:DUF2065 domain-containing protein [Hydrogenophaga sp.]|uniref:DUF2065 domain-containing protein n=1 Tax=Hydrogenophaga sp. TaxID=1904254 RepID=UPI0035AE0861
MAAVLPRSADSAASVDDVLWAALALVLVFEGLLPLVAPGLWRRVFSELMRLQDGQIRFYGLVTVALGLLVWWWPGN